MSQLAAPHTRRPGRAGAGVMALLWIAFGLALAFAPGSLDDLWGRLRSLPLLVELAAWLLGLPWLLGLAVLQSGWPIWVQTALVLCLAVGFTVAFTPREG